MSIIDNICRAELRITEAAQALIPEKFHRFQEIRDNKEKELANKKPQLMFYGIYSHGKSTLINALRGIDEAPMAIQPTTYQIDKYDCPKLNCVLVDTPGFQAKIEHTQEAEKQCRESLLVIFVVQSGEFEVALVWDKLKEVVRRKQKACLVINDFGNCLSDAEKVELLKDKFRSRMQEEFNDSEIVERVPLVIVNAKAALKARLENKSALLVKSNLGELEYRIREMVAECNLKEEAEKLLAAAFRQIISDCRAAAAKGTDATLAEAEENLEEIKKEKDKFQNRLYHELNYQIAAMELYSMFF